MDHIPYSIVVLATIVAPSVMTAQDVVIPNVQVMYDGSVNLTCADKKFDPDKVNINQNVQLMWLLPNGDVVKPSEEHARVRVYAYGKHITVFKVADVDFGVYNCIIRITGASSSKYQVVQHGLNIHGPYWGDLVAKYRKHIIIGCVAGAVVFVLMSGVCWFTNRNSPLNDKDYEKKRANRYLINGGEDNFALDISEFKDIISSQRANHVPEIATRL